VLDGGGWSLPCPGCFDPGKDQVPIVQEVGWAPDPFWTGKENLVSPGSNPKLSSPQEVTTDYDI